jgi:sugar phosphate isomerase/epimerase
VPHPTDRRSFLATASAAGLLAAAPRLRAADAPAPFKISLAQWSLHKAFGRGTKATLDPADFAPIAKTEYGIEAVEYVNQFYAAKKKDDAFLAELKKKADDHGVKSVLIMCDGEGNLGDPDDSKRVKAVDNHKRWVEWAKYLGCHSIRVNAASDWKKGFEETQKLAADGLRKLTEAAGPSGISVIVENHGGLSSHGGWLAGVMKLVGLPGCGTLPDFGNFNIGKIEGQPAKYDYYQGVDELMPFAKGVSAKSYDFDAAGNHTAFDYRRLMDIVCRKHKYSGYVGIEYEGSRLSEADGIKATKKLLETVRAELTKA